MRSLLYLLFALTRVRLQVKGIDMLLASLLTRR